MTIDVRSGAPEVAPAATGPALPDAARRRRRRRVNVPLVAAAAWLVLVCALALFAGRLPLHAYFLPVGVPRVAPGLHWPEPLGTDYLGRSMLSRVIYGARVSLTVGVGSVVIGLIAGGLIGILAGYFRGWVETLTSIVIDAALAFPPLVLLLAITGIMTQSLRTLVIALSILSIPSFARLARANTLVFARREFVLAAHAIGATDLRIIVREILPNVIFPIASYSFVIVAAIMVAEGSLSYLGLGIPPPEPSWGGMIAAGQPFLSTAPTVTFVPAAALLLTVLSFNVIGDWARRRFDVHESRLG